jgi:very-short-patch-repair endonuclease
MDTGDRRTIIKGARVAPDKRELARALRRLSTPSERRMWELLRGRRCLGLKFRRQQVIRGFIVDFYCAQLRIALEIDGGVHAEPDQRAWDNERTALLARSNIQVLRFPADAADEAVTARLAALLGHAREHLGADRSSQDPDSDPSGESEPAPPLPEGEGAGG